MDTTTIMGDNEGDLRDIFEDVDAEDVSFEEFREAVEAKVEQMGGLADKETAAMLIAHDLGDGAVEGIDDVKPGLDDVRFTAKVTSVGDLKEFDRDDGSEGRVLNVEVADETGTIRASFWDAMAEEAVEELEPGQVLGIAGRPKDGYSGVEVNVDDVETDVNEDVDVSVGDTYRVEDLSLGASGVNLRGTVLSVESVRTFDRDDGSEGTVANLVLGDPTGRIRVTMWGSSAELVEEFGPGESVEVVDGYVRERDGDLELHVNEQSTIEAIEESIDYDPDSTPIAEVEIGQTVDIAGVVRSTDPKRTFDRDDGSEGQVRNVRVQDETGDIRVALWGEKADREVGPGDEVAFTDVEIQDGWQDDLEASANWRSTVTVVDEGSAPVASDADDDADRGGASTGLDSFADDRGGTGSGSAATATATEQERVEVTGTVVQTGDPVILDDGSRTITVETDADVGLGQEITVRGTEDDDRIDADEVL
jgi:replication factor A1